ncbi:MAG: chemotaxis protein CheA [bacterium]
MTIGDQPLPDVLHRLRAELDLASAGDVAMLATVRASVARLTSLFPAELTTARRLAMLCTAVAKAHAKPRLGKAARAKLLRVLAAAIGALVEHVGDPDDFGRELLLTQAGKQILTALGRDVSEWSLIDASGEPAAPAAAPRDAVHPSSDLALDTAATLILMVEPHERAELEIIRDNLRRFATDTLSGELARELAHKAEASLAFVLESIDTGRDCAQAFAAATECVEETVRARDDEKDEASRTPRETATASAAPVPMTIPESDDRALVGDFLVECRDYLESAEGALLQLEADPADAEAINTVFRAFHTVKGTSAFLGLTDVSTFAHEAESLFSRVRDGEISFAGEVPDLALRALDVVKALLAELERGLKGSAMTRPAAYAVVLTDLAHVTTGNEAPMVVHTAPELIVDTRRRDRSAPDSTTPERREETGPPRESRSTAADSSIRVSTERLDRLIDMLGELVIAHTMIAQDERLLSAGQDDLSHKATHASKIVRELHDLSLSMRMVPLKPTFQKMTRLVRDVTASLGKQVRFITEGDETEIDRNMVDALSDPLVHMVRNAIDHGIESPDARSAAGKPRQGTVRLSATHSGGSVLVELRDDGKGLDRERIIAKAIARGLIVSAAKMSDSDIFNLIFAPGFSTAEKVTDVSGRGVGMDVVKRSIDTLRGRVEITSTPGQGTLFSLRLPLTLAVTDGMLVRVGTERYVIPITNIVKSFRPERDALSSIAGGGEMVRLHDDVMPIVRLHTLFNIAGAIVDPCDALIVAVASGDQSVAMLVDELLGQHQVVAKSLGKGVGQIDGVSGAAILGDGRIGLILDVGELLALVRYGTDGVRSLRAVA